MTVKQTQPTVKQQAGMYVMIGKQVASSYPWWAMLIAFLVGVAVGLIVLGWWLWPVQWNQAKPSSLSNQPSTNSAENRTYMWSYLNFAATTYGTNSMSLEETAKQLGEGWTVQEVTAVLNQMIDEKILLQETKKRKIVVAKREIEDGVNEVKKRFPNPEDFQTELKKQSLTEAEFEKRIQDQLMVIKLIDSEIKVKVGVPKEEEITKLYDRVVNQIDGKKDPNATAEEENEIASLAKFFQRRTAERVRVKHILVRVEKNAGMQDKTTALNKIKEVQQKIKNGEDFSELARKYSEDPGSKEQGGDLGFFVHGDMVPEFEKVAFSLPVGEVSDIVETDFGYHLIECEEKKAKSKLVYNEVKEELQEYLYRSKAEKIYQDFLKQLRSNATIKISEIE